MTFSYKRDFITVADENKVESSNSENLLSVANTEGKAWSRLHALR